MHIESASFINEEKKFINTVSKTGLSLPVTGRWLVFKSDAAVEKKK